MRFIEGLCVIAWGFVLVSLERACIRMYVCVCGGGFFLWNKREGGCDFDGDYMGKIFFSGIYEIAFELLVYVYL